eukprot:TRINITY_DN15813_c0_g1_i1.p1 TRINITY_DN15813_c0_g1~~TRINITY_DN15813_c0_g1_i1.p1  ORF type:complete len:319 (+),score=60.67 TRINITY_DN15813_c0_g1_i1:41-958(+)
MASIAGRRLWKHLQASLYICHGPRASALPLLEDHLQISKGLMKLGHRSLATGGDDDERNLLGSQSIECDQSILVAENVSSPESEEGEVAAFVPPDATDVLKVQGPELSDEFFEQEGLGDDIESLILMEDVSEIPGLPPLDELRYDPEDSEKAARRQMELLKQEEQRRMRVPQVDDFGRSYATGRRKTSSARVWLREADGQMQLTINGRSYDSYFPSLSHRAMLLQPFLVTNTLGRFEVKCTVEGGGVSGQAGAIRHGITRALQSFDPSLRPTLKSEGLLTRDPRMVERKKPGKAGARKSFQWVKR